MLFGLDLAHIIEIIGYPGIFAVVLAESGLFFAVSLPGASLLFTAGFLASQGYLHIGILVATVLVAAVLGDTIGYWFGSWVGPTLFKRNDSRFFKKKHLEQTRVFFQKHGSKTVLLARFIPVVRTFTPILAGVGEMNYRVFLMYNALGALLWGGGFTLGGYFLGHSIPGVENYLEYIIIGIILVTVSPLAYEMYKQRKAGTPAKSPTLPKAVIFDLDDTLAESFTPPSDAILDKLLRLSQSFPIAIMSGAEFMRMHRDILARIPKEPTDAAYYIFSDSAAQCHVWKEHRWEEVYSFPMRADEHARIEKALADAVSESAIFKDDEDTSRILKRETSVAFTALESGSTREEKLAWDPGGAKRKKLARIIKEKLPDHEVLIGGKTTIDVTGRGISKAYGVEWLSRRLGFEPKDMLFVGDGFGEGGNDAVVIPTGIQTRPISSTAETERIIDELLQKI